MWIKVHWPLVLFEQLTFISVDHSALVKWDQH